MIKIDLITGFLGSGKTTFIKKYARFLIEKGNKIGIIENDFGAVNVDLMLLQSELGEQCDLEMISGGCDKETHQRRFKTKLIAMGMLGYDRILIEPSCIYDVDEFFDVLHEEPLDQWYEIGSVIAIVDAKLGNQLSKYADGLLALQAANAGCILLSKIQEAAWQETKQTAAHLQRALRAIHCQREIQNVILAKDWNELTEADFERICNSGYVLESYVKSAIQGKNDFSTLYFFNVSLTHQQLLSVVQKLFYDVSCGNIVRIKGFISTPEQGWLELNASKDHVSLQPVQVGQDVVIVIGEALAEEKIKTYFK